MTYREMMQRDHPEESEKQYIAGCPGSHYKGAPIVIEESCALCQIDDDATKEECAKACAACWDQEVAE